jgi:hypothetical protein
MQRPYTRLGSGIASRDGKARVIKCQIDLWPRQMLTFFRGAQLNG